MSGRKVAGEKNPCFAFFAVFVALWAMPAGNAGASGGDEFVGGTIAAKGPVLDENGKRIWVEYDGGTFSNFIYAPDGSGFDENSVVMPAGEYRAYVADFHAVLNENADDAEILTRAEYMEREFLNVEGQPVEKPVLAEKTKSAVVRTAFVDDFLLLESPIDLNSIAQPGGGAKSLLLDENGRVVFESALHIGFLSAFYSEDPTDIGSFCETSMKDYQKGHKLWAPVQGAEITATNSAQRVWSDADGDFRISYVIPSCPGTELSQTNQLLAKLRYCVFDPQRMNYSGVYYLKHEMRDTCSGIGEGHFGFTMSGLTMKDSAGSIERSVPEQKRGKANIAVDVAILTGRGILQNEKRPGIWLDPAYLSSGISAGQNRRGRLARRPMNTNDGIPIGIPIGDVTAYGYEQPAFFRGWPLDPDLDADGVSDIADDPYAGTVDVWLDDTRDIGGDPDLTRLGDFNPDLAERGLLLQISLGDLLNTDTYVFHDGNLLFEYQGLRPDEIGPDGTISYSFKIRGPADGASDVENRLFRIENSDRPKVGDTLKVVAINRATGYMGIVTTIYDNQLVDNGIITVPVGNIRMRPPNLCITVRRKYVIEKGLTAGEESPEYTIGFEGAGLASDKSIAIETEWTDWDDRPLPDEMLGFTGRLAVVDSQNHLTDLVQFAINPGRHTVVMRLPDQNADLHFYMHVGGESVFGTPNFENTGPGPELLAHRPRLYVPVRVPIYKEAATAAIKNALYAAVREAREIFDRLQCDPDTPDTILENASQNLFEATMEFENKAKPEYKYVYRPEMQFSLYDLDVNEIRRTWEIAPPETDDILDDDIPIISPSDETIEIRYTLDHFRLPDDPLNQLPVLGRARELLFSLGARRSSPKSMRKEKESWNSTNRAIWKRFKSRIILQSG